MKKVFSYITIFLLLFISVGYLVNGYKFFALLNKSSNNPIHVPTNWVVQSVDYSIADTIKLQKGDSIIGVAEDRQDNFLTLDNDLVANKGKTVDLTIMRGGKELTVQSEIPSDFEVNDFEKRIIFEPTYKGDPDIFSLTPYVRNRLIFGQVILLILCAVTLADAVLIYMKKQVGWYVGVGIVLMGLAGVISGASMSRLMSRSALFLGLALCLLLSYKKIRKEP